MIITKLYGGLGNQMFQYAMGRNLSLLLNEELFIDTSSFETYTLRRYELDCFSLHSNIANKELLRRILYPTTPVRYLFQSGKILFSTGKLPIRKYSEPHFHFDPKALYLRGDVCLGGYWQSEKYFQQNNSRIKEDFVFSNEPNTENKGCALEIVQANSVSIHIRRGDYETDPKSQSVHGACSTEYYQNAVEYIAKQITDPHFYIFSDDPKWFNQNCHVQYPVTNVNHNTAEKSFEDLRLMSLCKHNIIANSSYSWWGAWLNNNKNKIVIAPKKWFNDPTKDTKDLIPESWVKI